MAAVRTASRRAMVLAGSGSGKTRVLTERIAYLIEKKKVSPWEIMAFSFTRKASNEIKDRLDARLLSTPTYAIAMGTMHSIALSYLRRFGDVIGLRASHLTVYSAWEEQFLLKEVARELGIYKSKWKIPKKDIDRTFNDYYEVGAEPAEIDQCHLLFNTFIQRCKENQSMTYGGLLVGMDLLIPTLAKHLKIKHILVDEVQDINLKQWHIINGMVEAFGASLFVVGDIDQSIYSFRGAVPEYLIDHKEQFDVYRIETNYRSDAHVVNMANRLIDRNEQRFEKTMRPFEDAQTPVQIIRNVQSNEVISLCGCLNDKAPDVRRAILCRIHAPLKKISMLMEERGIDHTYVGSKSELTKSESFRRLHAFLKLVVNPYDNFSFLLIRDLIGLSSEDYSRIRLIAAEEGKSHFQAWYSYEAATDVRAFYKFEMEEGGESSLSAVIHNLLVDINPSVEQLEAWTDTVNFIEEWDCKNAGSIADYLQWLATYDLQDEIAEDQPGLQLMTIHAAKGLEWPTVIIAGCNEGILPSRQAIKNDEIEEERRLAYVAWTRARDQLILTARPTETVDSRGKTHKNPMSRFIGESQ